eukprot:6873328-Pyramimonas_sp.AAC.1
MARRKHRSEFGMWLTLRQNHLYTHRGGMQPALTEELPSAQGVWQTLQREHQSALGMWPTLRREHLSSATGRGGEPLNQR